MLVAGDRVPDANVWMTGVDGPIEVREAIAGDGTAMLCFYPFDWSPG